MKLLKRPLCGILLVLSVFQLFGTHCFADQTADVIFAEMLERAESIVNYEWTPVRDIDVWNENPYNGKMVFPAGETVTGMPYTLFSWEFGFDSLLSLAQYRSKAAVNYSVTAYCSSMGADRTGPVYGSCCATFVSEVLGGSFMNEGNPRYDNCSGIENSQYGTTFYNVKMADIKPGDALINTSRGHVVWVGAVDDDSLTIYEQTPPVAKKTVISKASVTSEGYMYYGGKTYSIVTRSNELTGSFDDGYARTDRFPLPIRAYTADTGKTVVYDSVNGNVKANRIYDTDLCTVITLFENGWCYVRFPLDAGGTDSGYVQTSVFFDFGQQPTANDTTEWITAYRRSDISTVLSRIPAGARVFLITQTDAGAQLMYPLSSGEYEVGWIAKSDMGKLTPAPAYLPGDVNGDGCTNGKDLTRFMKYLAGETADVTSAALDVNGDGAVNGKDLTRLMKYLAGENVPLY